MLLFRLVSRHARENDIFLPLSKTEISLALADSGILRVQFSRGLHVVVLQRYGEHCFRSAFQRCGTPAGLDFTLQDMGAETRRYHGRLPRQQCFCEQPWRERGHQSRRQTRPKVKLKWLFKEAVFLVHIYRDEPHRLESFLMIDTPEAIACAEHRS